MPSSTPNVVVSTTTSASDVHDKIDDFENFVNYEIEGDQEIQGPGNSISEDRWVETKHIWAPEFYGAPDPRTELTSSRVHYRRTLNDLINQGAHFSIAHSAKSWVHIPGLTATVKLRRDCVVDIYATWFAFEYGGIASNAGSLEQKRACKFRLAVDNVGKTSTTRYLRASCALNSHFTRKQFSIVKQLELSAGVHNIGVRCRMEERSFYSFSGKDWDDVLDHKKFVFVGGRNLEVDAHNIEGMVTSAAEESKVGEADELAKYGQEEVLTADTGPETDPEYSKSRDSY